QRVLAIEFNKNTGVIENIQEYDQNNINEIAFYNDRTVTRGHTIGVFEQLIGNLGKFNSSSTALGRAADRK
ncbi:MAG: hypothetical protein AAF383_30265, partial [Cyanobacteria bacterium P01_A01_bin.83]